MGYLIGGPDCTPSGGVGTWGKLRRAMGQSFPLGLQYQYPTVMEEFNLEWQVQAGDSFFKSSVGSGFVKGGFLIGAPPVFQFPSYNNIFGPFITIDIAALFIDVRVTLAPTCDDNPFMTDLVGQTVTGGTTTPFAITAAMYTTNPDVPGSGADTGPITAIGLLTPV